MIHVLVMQFLFVFSVYVVVSGVVVGVVLVVVVVVVLFPFSSF